MIEKCLTCPNEEISETFTGEDDYGDFEYGLCSECLEKLDSNLSFRKKIDKKLKQTREH